MGHRLTSDDDLMRAAAGGDEAAFAALMGRHRSWVRALIHSIVRDADQADDLTQEVFCRVHRHLGTYVGRGSFAPWVKRIAANLAKDALRKQKQLTILSSDSLEEVATEEHRIDPMEALTLGVLRDELRSAIQSLPDEQRLALVMHYFGDMSLQDIAWAMRCPVGTVKSRLFYALRRVREALTKQRASE